MKRALVYHHFDVDDVIDPYVIYFLGKMKEFGCDIIFGSNSQLDKAELEKLAPFTKDITLRENRGWDFASWKQMLLEHGREHFEQYDEVIIANSTIYGPLFDLEEVFATMAAKRCDFWTPTKHTAAYGIPEHVQPYFFVATRKVIQHDAFWAFWSSIKEDYPDMWTLIWDGEIRLSYELAKVGLTYDVVAPVDDPRELRDLGHYEPYVLHAAAYLIEAKRLPFVKMKAFYAVNSRPFTGTRIIFDALDWTGSDYPRSLIINHQRRTSPLSWAKNLPGTLLIPGHEERADDTGKGTPVPAKAVTAKTPAPKRSRKPKVKPVGVFAHLYYPETLEFFQRYLSMMPVPFDLNVTTPSKEVATAVRAFSKADNPMMKDCEVRIVENRGRDIGPWIVEFPDKQMSYDLALKLHVKKHSQQTPVFSHVWNRFLFDCLMGSSSEMQAIVDAFSADENLGLVFPPYPPSYNMMYPLGYTGSGEDQEHRQAIFDRLGISPPKESTQPIFSAGGMSWYRPKALARLFGAGLSIEDFPAEPFPTSGTIGHGLERAIPYIAQADGYSYRLSMPQRTLLQAFQMYEDRIMSSYQPTPDGEPARPPVPGVYDSLHIFAHALNRSYNARMPRIARHTQGVTVGLRKLLFQRS